MATIPLMMSLADELKQMSMAPFYEMANPSMYYHGRHPYGQMMLHPHHHHSHHEHPSIAGPGHMAMRPTVGSLTGMGAKVGKDGYQVCMDVSQFKPSELNVKVVDTNHIVVEGRHEEREDDHGYISRHFKRRYTLPKGYDAEKVMSTLSSDGVLTVSVPKPLPVEGKSSERMVQIQQVGPAHLNVKENPTEAEKKDEITNEKKKNGK